MFILKLLVVLLCLFLGYVLFLFICSLFVNPKKEYTNNSPFYRFLLYSASSAALKLLRIKVHITGVEKIPTDVNPLFVGNHRSNFDPIVQWMALKKWNLAFISKESNFKIPFFGRFIRKCCFMAIDRVDPRKAVSTIKNATHLLEKGEVSVAVYPEGTRSKNCDILPFHNGVFRIAQRADRPIVVMAIKGTEQIHKNIPWRRSDVYLEIADVIPTQKAKTMKANEISDEVRAALESALEKKQVHNNYEVHSL